MAYEIQEAKELVVKAGKELIEKGLIAHTRATLSRHRKRAFTLPLIVIIQQLISLFILTKRLQQSSASQV